MKKKILAMLLTTVMCMSVLPMTASAEDTIEAQDTVEAETSVKQLKSVDAEDTFVDATGEYQYYIKEDGTAGIWLYLGDEASVVIPSELDGYAVTEIDDWAFWVDQVLITDVVIPEGVEKIGEYAFASWNEGKFYATALESVTLPSTLKVIENGAFIGSTELTGISIPEGVEEIGTGAFAYCLKLMEFTLPASVTSIDCGILSGCVSLESIEVDQESEYFTTYDGCLYDKNMTFLYNVPAGKSSVELPDTLVEIGSYAFESCHFITEIDIPEDLIYIEQMAFLNCGIENIVLPEGMITLDSYAFADCVNLESVTIPSSVQELGEDIFEGTSENLVLKVYADSAALAYAQENGIAYELITDGVFDFYDVFENDWYYEPIVYVYDNRIMTGLNAEYFGPSDMLSRAQFAVVLHRMEDAGEATYYPTYPDVASGIWYTDAVLWASHLDVGIVTGYTHNGMFGTADNITREQMAVMMYRYAQYKGYDTSVKGNFSSYRDANQVSAFAKEAMQWAVGNGIITGKENGTMLEPQGDAARAECAMVIMRFAAKYES